MKPLMHKMPCFPSKPNHCNQMQVFLKAKIIPNTNIYMENSEISLNSLHLCNNMNLPNISRFGNALI